MGKGFQGSDLGEGCTILTTAEEHGSVWRLATPVFFTLVFLPLDSNHAFPLSLRHLFSFFSVRHLKTCQEHNVKVLFLLDPPTLFSFMAKQSIVISTEELVALILRFPF